MCDGRVIQNILSRCEIPLTGKTKSVATIVLDMADDTIRDVYDDTRGYDPQVEFEDFETVAEGNAVRDKAGGILDEEAEGINAINTLADARERNQERSAHARDVDDDLQAEVTTDLDKWSADPDSYDFPGIDTPEE